METTHQLLFWAIIRRSCSGRIMNSIRPTSRRACSAQRTAASLIPMQTSSFLIGTMLAESQNSLNAEPNLETAERSCAACAAHWSAPRRPRNFAIVNKNGATYQLNLEFHGLH